MYLIFGYYYPEFEVKFYYTRKELASSTAAVADPKEIARENINNQLKEQRYSQRESC